MYPIGFAATSNPNAQSTAKAPSDTDPGFKSKSGVAGADTPTEIIKSSRKGGLPVILLVFIVIVLAAAVFFFLSYDGYILKAPTTTTVSTIPSKISTITSCEIIPRPGDYFLASNVKTQIQGGPCINVSVSNVNIECDSNKITGSGPYVDVPPFTYGVWIVNKTNVTITGCNIENFSYGVFVENSNNININNNNVSVNYVSNIYLNNTHNSSVGNNYLSKASGPDGSIYLTNRTSGVNINNNSVEYNLFYGINVNASNNTFSRNFLNNTQFAFRCSVPNGFVISSKAYGNICYNSTGCGFVSCIGINIPTNISKLTVQNPINECGSITSSGTYVLSSNINMQNYVNITNILSLLTPCIRVAAQDVVINCKGFTIYNSTIGISDMNEPNLTIENCNIVSAEKGIVLLNATQTTLYNVTLTKEEYGLEITNTSIGTVTNLTATGDTYGVTLSGSFSNIFQNLNLLHNTFGLYLDNNSFSNTFNKGTILNNTQMDVYATPDSANASYDLMLSITCGYTNAIWGTCAHYVPPPSAFIPVTTCRTISLPGNYLLLSSIEKANSNCIQILSSNVIFNCINHIISASPSVVGGSAMVVSNSTNVSVYSCGFNNFKTSLNVYNSSAVVINNASIQGSLYGQYGISLNNVVNATVFNSLINGTSNASISLVHTKASKILKNVITYGEPNLNIGILINNSQNNLISNNTGSRNNIGMYLIGNSLNNTILSNLMQLSTKFDYECIGINNALAAENGGVNYGTTANICDWLATITPANPTISCTLVQQPGLIFITQDYKYDSGSDCFDISANDTTINCAGHTILATNGGTFANFTNSQGGVVKNCLLKGFSSTIVAKNSTISVLNNTIFQIRHRIPGPP